MILLRVLSAELDSYLKQCVVSLTAPLRSNQLGEDAKYLIIIWGSCLLKSQS
jgi:hypothetical protein